MKILEELLKNVKNGVLFFIKEYPLMTGIIFILIGLSLMIYQLKNNESFKMSEHNVISWKALVSIWTLIIMLISYGVILIYRY